MGELEAHPDSTDAISHLHKMSTTAGAASQDYVAINTLSVVSILLGAASALVIVVDWWFLLLIPAAALVVALVAFRQVHNSNGTQTGRAMAVVAVVLALGLGAGRAYQNYAEEARVRPDKQRVIAMTSQLGAMIKAGQYQDAYVKLFRGGPRGGGSFKDRISAQTFEERWRGFQANARPILGELVSIESSDRVNVGQIGDTRIAETLAVLRFERTDAAGKKLRTTDHISLRFQEDPSGELRIEDMPDLFRQEDPRGAPRR